MKIQGVVCASETMEPHNREIFAALMQLLEQFSATEIKLAI